MYGMADNHESEAPSMKHTTDLLSPLPFGNSTKKISQDIELNFYSLDVIYKFKYLVNHLMQYIEQVLNKWL